MNPRHRLERLSAAARYIVPAGLLAAGVLFLFLPVAGIACGDTSRPTQLCYSGVQLITGDKGLNMGGFEGGHRSWSRISIAHAIDLPPSLPTLASAAAAILAVGALLIWGWAAAPKYRTVVGFLAPVAAGAAIVVAEFQVLIALLDGAENLVYEFSSHHDMEGDPRDLVATGPGFWLPLVVLTAMAALMTFAHFFRPPVAEPEAA